MAGKQEGLHYGKLGERCVHLCVDMQRMFAAQTDWHTPWLHRVLPTIRRLVEAHPAQTIFTRFIPAGHLGDGEGAWRRYYQRWASMTLERLGAPMADLVPELAAFVPPAEVVDKQAYSPWYRTDLEERLGRRKIDTLVVTGGETDVCVLATVMGAIDRGYRVILVTDGLCSSADETHDSMMTLYGSRFAEQLELADCAEVLGAWTL
jgi:nicotinamidase-related amidase